MPAQMRIGDRETIGFRKGNLFCSSMEIMFQSIQCGGVECHLRIVASEAFQYRHMIIGDGRELEHVVDHLSRASHSACLAEGCVSAVYPFEGTIQNQTCRGRSDANKRPIPAQPTRHCDKSNARQTPVESCKSRFRERHVEKIGHFLHISGPVSQNGKVKIIETPLSGSTPTIHQSIKSVLFSLTVCVPPH